MDKYLFMIQHLTLLQSLSYIFKHSLMQLSPSKRHKFSSLLVPNNHSQTHSQLNNSYLTYQPYLTSPRHKPYHDNPSTHSANSQQYYSPPNLHTKSVQNEYLKNKISPEHSAKYEAIQQILKRQNKNLQEQNHLLLSQIQRLRNSNRKYKTMSQNQKLQIEQLREQCRAHKQYAEEMKEEIMAHLKELQQKALQPSQSQNEQSLVVITGLSFNESSCNREQ